MRDRTVQSANNSSKRYGTFSDQQQALRDLEDTTRMMTDTQRQLAETEQISHGVLSSVHDQGHQIHRAHDNVRQTKGIVEESKRTLKQMAYAAFANTLILWAIIVALSIADILVFYYLFLK